MKKYYKRTNKQTNKNTHGNFNVTVTTYRKLSENLTKYGTKMVHYPHHRVREAEVQNRSSVT